MRSRVLTILTAFATLTPAFAAPAFAQRPQVSASVAFQGQEWARGRGQDQSFDRNDVARERAMYARYTGRDSRWQFAFRDGYNEGLRDARTNRRFDPTDSSQYRAANRGYSRSWGSRTQFAVGYRSAFRDGYERGYYDIAHRRTGFSLFFHWGR